MQFVYKKAMKKNCEKILDTVIQFCFVILTLETHFFM